MLDTWVQSWSLLVGHSSISKITRRRHSKSWTSRTLHRCTHNWSRDGFLPQVIGFSFFENGVQDVDVAVLSSKSIHPVCWWRSTWVPAGQSLGTAELSYALESSVKKVFMHPLLLYTESPDSPKTIKINRSKHILCHF